MKIGASYSHLNGVEFMKVHHPALWDEVIEIIAGVDAEKHKTKRSQEKTKLGAMLYSPTDMNKAFKLGFESRGWSERRSTFWVTDDEKVLRGIQGLSEDDQRKAIEESGRMPIKSYNQTDFVKDRVAVEVQFGKYAFVAHDLFVKHMELLRVGYHRRWH